MKYLGTFGLMHKWTTITLMLLFGNVSHSVDETVLIDHCLLIIGIFEE